MAMFSGVIGFIGAGNMAQAIAFGLIEAGAIPAKNIIASAPSMNNLVKFKEKSANITHNNNIVIDKSDIIFLSVKPQYLDAAIKSLNNIPHEEKLYVSILAGVKLETLLEKFQLHSNNKSSYKIIRVLPNIAVLVGAGCSVMAANANTPEEDITLVKSMMSVGSTCELIAENLINPCSDVCGSGPDFESCDIKSNLLSNNNMSITLKNVALLNSTSEPLTVPVHEKYSDQEDMNFPDWYIDRNLSSSKCESFDGSTTIDSEVESMSESSSNNLRKSNFKELHKSTEDILKNRKKHRLNISRNNHKDYQGYDLRQKLSSNYSRVGHSHTCDHFHNSEACHCTGISESSINESTRQSSRKLSRRNRTHFRRYSRLTDDYICDRKSVHNNERRYISDYYAGRNRSVPYFADNYLARRMPSSYNRRSSAYSYDEYYRDPYTVMNRKYNADSYNPFPHLNIGYSFGEPSSFSNQNYSPSHQNPAFHPLQVIIMRFNRKDSISSNMAAKIRSTLILMINSTFGSGFSPKFESTTLMQNGHFLISCSDECTANWLLKQHLMEEDGTPFVIMKLIDLPSMHIVETFVTYNWQPVRQVLECLMCQNPSLCTDQWLLSKESVSESGQFLRFFIDEGSFKCLEFLKWKPYFQLHRLRFQKINIQEEEICVLCKLFSTTCSLRTTQS